MVETSDYLSAFATSHKSYNEKKNWDKKTLDLLYEKYKCGLG